MNLNLIRFKELQESLAGYTLDKEGKIANSDEFKGQFPTVPFFYFYAVQGWGERLKEGKKIVFDIIDEDVEIFPELKGKKQFVLNIHKRIVSGYAR
jgi:hypothetical protein